MLFSIRGRLLAAIFTAALVATAFAVPALADPTTDGTYTIDLSDTVAGNGPFGGGNRYWDYTKSGLSNIRQGTYNGHTVMLLPSGHNRMRLTMHDFPMPEQVCVEVYEDWANPSHVDAYNCQTASAPTKGYWDYTFCVPDGVFQVVEYTYDIGYGAASIAYTADIASDYLSTCGNAAP